MAIAYYGAQISAHMDMTPEGFLICRDVPINRIGDQQYLAYELQLDGDPERVVNVHRYPEDVFSPDALNSFEAKDVTQGHPPENVTPENHALYSKGHCENVRRRGDFTVADLVIKDASLISDIRNGVIREISCGYTCQYVPDGNGYRQTNIHGNHVAVVLRGRAGSEVSIKDAAQEAEKGRKYMSKFTEAVLSAFGMAAKEAKTPEEINALVSTTATALDAQPADSGLKDSDAVPQQTAVSDALGEKLDKVIEMLDALKPEEKPAGKEDGGKDDGDGVKKLDDELKKLGGDAQTEETSDICLSGEAKDAAVAMLRSMRPVVAAIKDEDTRVKVTDALIAAIQEQGKMGEIAAAAQAGARKAADQAAMTSYEKRCTDSQEAYAARNPHKRKEKEA